MARLIKPGDPVEVKPVNVTIPDIDLTIFDKLGDNKIKSAMENFNLYATATISSESQSLYKKYANNPLALANALEKLPDSLSELPESVQKKFAPKIQTTAYTLVSKAAQNHEKAVEKQNKLLAKANASMNMQQISYDFSNLLGYITAPEDEKKPMFMEIYKARRQELNNLANLTDNNGNPLLPENVRTKMTMPKEAIVAGFTNFIGNMELDQLKKWDTDIFQNKTKFMEDTGIDDDTYESCETKLKKRMKELADTSERQIHGQAWHDSTNLITQPTQVELEKAKSYGLVNEKDLDTIVNTSKEMTLSTYYDPKKQTNPAAFIRGINVYTQLLNQIPDSPTIAEQQRAIAGIAEANKRLLDLAKETNLPPEITDRITASMQKALNDKQAKQALTNINWNNKVNTYLASVPQNLKGTALTRAARTVEDVSAAEMAQKEQYQDAEQKWTQRAVEQYNTDMETAIMYYLAGDYPTFNQLVTEADRRFDKTRASFIVQSDLEWQRLENALAQNKPAMVEWEGRMLEFKGFNNRGAMFQERN